MEELGSIVFDLAGRSALLAQYWLLAKLGVKTDISQMLLKAQIYELCRSERGTPPEKIDVLLRLFTTMDRFRCIKNATLQDLAAELRPGNCLLIATTRASLKVDNDLGRILEQHFVWDQATYIAFPIVVKREDFEQTPITLMDPFQDRPIAHISEKCLLALLENTSFSLICASQEETHASGERRSSYTEAWGPGNSPPAPPIVLASTEMAVEALSPLQKSAPLPASKAAVGTHHTDVGTHHTDVGTHHTDVGTHHTDVGAHDIDAG